MSASALSTSLTIGIPYLKKLGGRDGAREKAMGKVEYAQASRDALQHYLVGLIRAVVSKVIRTSLSSDFPARVESTVQIF